MTTLGPGARHLPVPASRPTSHSARNGWFHANPHLPDAEFVGTYVHSYDSSHRLPYPSPIPAMRPSDDVPVRPRSSTPIYDALYAEYRRSFKALPGDRSGEEGADFAPFDSLPSTVDWDRISSWGRAGPWEATGRRRRRNPPPALPPGNRDDHGHGAGDRRHGL